MLTLAGDEETMGPLGTKLLLDQVPHATGEATIIGDAGSPMVARFGEKGFIWIEITAEGKAAHGAHVHLGVNAMDRLRDGAGSGERVARLPVAMPDQVRSAIAAAKSISEPLWAWRSGRAVAVTVNIGIVSGGTSPNLVPSSAHAAIDIRLPVGVAAEAVLARLRRSLDLPGITWRVLRCFEPNYTDPDDELVRCCAAAAAEIMGKAPAVNMRVGGSDSRWFRMAGIPTVVYGPTPYNMGAPDEYAEISELGIVSRVHALTAFDLLTKGSERRMSDLAEFVGPETFMGLPAGLPQPGCRAAILGVPFDCGTHPFRVGARQGPLEVRRQSRLIRRYHPSLADVDVLSLLGAVDAGDVALVPGTHRRCLRQDRGRRGAHRGNRRGSGRDRRRRLGLAAADAGGGAPAQGIWWRCISTATPMPIPTRRTIATTRRRSSPMRRRKAWWMPRRRGTSASAASPIAPACSSTHAGSASASSPSKT